MRRALLAATLVATVAGFASAQIPGRPDPKLATAGTYQIDPGHTQVLFTVNHQGFTEYTGQFTQPTGTLTLDPANPANDKVEVSFPIAKVSTTVPALDKHLMSADFFDAAQFPEGRFVSTQVTVKGTTATIAGNLTLHGVTRPVTLQAHFIGAGANPQSKKTNVGFQATTIVRRSEFGIKFALPAVSDDVRLTINAAFQAQ